MNYHFNFSFPGLKFDISIVKLDSVTDALESKAFTTGKQTAIFTPIKVNKSCLFEKVATNWSKFC